MGEIAVPILLSLFLGPGMGQLYNREFKKAVYLIVLSVIVVVAAVVWFYKAMMPYLPVDLVTTDQAALRKLVENAVTHVMSGQGSTLLTYKTILLVLWMYSVVDAYRGALRRQKLKSQQPQP